MAPKVAIVFVSLDPKLPRQHPQPGKLGTFSIACCLSDSVIQYSMYGHIKALAEAEKKGIESAGGQVDVYQ
jgi:hypothetical protein